MKRVEKLVIYCTIEEKKAIQELSDIHRFGNTSRYVVESILKNKEEILKK